MNRGQIEKQLGLLMRLRPFPIRVGQDGQVLPQIDDHWRLEAILDGPTRLKLSNQATGHVLELQSDNVREYRSPDFLLLRCQLTIDSRGVHIEPVHQFNEVFARLELQMPALLDEMRKDLAALPLRREIVLLKRSWIYMAKGNELVYYLDDHDELLSAMQVLGNHGLVSDITYNEVGRFLMSEELARYLVG
jgi:hypothetical protein